MAEDDYDSTWHTGLLLPDLGQLLLVQLVALQAVLVLHIEPGHLVVRMRGHAPRPAHQPHLAVYGVVHLVTQTAHSSPSGLGCSLCQNSILKKNKFYQNQYFETIQPGMYTHPLVHCPWRNFHHYWSA